MLRAYNYWDFPKGMVESGEEPLATARREVEEETGITSLKFSWGHDFRETAPYRAGKIARYYVAATLEEDVVLPINPELGKPEHHEWRWVSVEEAGVLLGERLQPILAWASETMTG